MNVMLAFNVVWLIFGFPIFDLDRGMVDAVLSADFRGVSQDGLFVAVDENVCTHGWLANAERPDVEIVNFHNVLDGEELFSEILDFDILRSALHENANAVLYNMGGCEHHKNREEVCANWICQMPVVISFGVSIEVDEQSCDHHSNRLDDISNYVNHCCTQVIVILFTDVRQILLLSF